MYIIRGAAEAFLNREVMLKDGGVKYKVEAVPKFDTYYGESNIKTRKVLFLNTFKYSVIIDSNKKVFIKLKNKEEYLNFLSNNTVHDYDVDIIDILEIAPEKVTKIFEGHLIEAKYLVGERVFKPKGLLEYLVTSEQNKSKPFYNNYEEADKLYLETYKNISSISPNSLVRIVCSDEYLRYKIQEYRNKNDYSCMV